jgi:multisubunit Na+/H+ antiporter MnhB subunit
VNLIIGGLVAAAVTAIAIVAMLLVRRRAPEGSHFQDGDRASGVFGVLATGFSVLLGFIIVIAFESYNESVTGADVEATVVAQQVQTAQFLPEATSATLTGQLICFARSVVGPEWDALEAGRLPDAINPWGAEMYRTIKTVEPQTAVEQSAYDRWMDQTSERERARIARVHGAEGLIPAPLWIVLILIFVVILVYMLFFADPAEGAVTQGMLMGSVTAILTTLLLLLVYFNNPHGGAVGSLQPVAMDRTLATIDAQLEVAGLTVEPPCGEDGRAR